MTSTLTEEIIYADNLFFLKSCKYCPQLIYIDPPFNTGKIRTKGNSFFKFDDTFENYLEFIRPRIEAGYSILDENGSFFLHVDPRESHYCKIILDEIFGRENFKNEIIWSYDFGGRSKNKWPSKHDVIFWYTKNSKHYTFNYNEMDRLPYMAPGLVGKEKAERGKTPTDVWWNTIVPTNGKEKTGYPTQKPLKILERILKIHTNPGDLVMDYFAGSGTTGYAAKLLNRSYVLVDKNIEAIRVMEERLHDN